MKLIPSLFIAAAAVMMSPASALSETATISSPADVRSVLADNLDLRYAVDSDGDIQIDFANATVWISFFNSNGDRVKADTQGAVSRLRVFSHVRTSDPSDYDKFVKAANKLNKMYMHKAYVTIQSDKSLFVMERYEFVTGTYTAEQFLRAFRSFGVLLGEVSDGNVHIGL